jgi:hypothetical protein
VSNCSSSRPISRVYSRALPKPGSLLIFSAFLNRSVLVCSWFFRPWLLLQDITVQSAFRNYPSRRPFGRTRLPFNPSKPCITSMGLTTILTSLPLHQKAAEFGIFLPVAYAAAQQLKIAASVVSTSHRIPYQGTRPHETTLYQGGLSSGAASGGPPLLVKVSCRDRKLHARLIFISIAKIQMSMLLSIACILRSFRPSRCPSPWEQ